MRCIGGTPLAPPPTPLDDHVQRFHWEQDRQRWEDYRQENAVRLQRLREVLRLLADEGANGRLVTELRLVAGGDYFAPPPGMWNVEPVEARFRHGQLRARPPGGRADLPSYIFFTRESLNSAIAAKRSKAPAPPLAAAAGRRSAIYRTGAGDLFVVPSGEVVQPNKSIYVASKGTSAPRIEDLLPRHADGWREAIQSLLHRLRTQNVAG